MIYHCIQCSSNESNRKSNQFCVSTQNLSHICHTNAAALHVWQDACSQGLFICNLFQWKNKKKWRTQFPFLPSQNIAATSETRTLQNIFHKGPGFSSKWFLFFFKDVDGFPALIPRKIATKKVRKSLVPSVDGGMAHVASRPRASRLLEMGTSSVFHDFFVPMDPGWWEKMPERWIAGLLGGDFF